MSKLGLVFIAHGSRNLASNDQIIQLTEKLNKALTNKYSFVNYAFLEFETPTITDAINLQIQNGSTAIDIFPYFLSMGNHVSKDIPDIIDAAREKYPEVVFQIFPPLGASQEIIDLMINLLQCPEK